MVAILAATEARADACPTAKDEIVTDRPDVTNSSLVVPTGSLQSENGETSAHAMAGGLSTAPTHDGASE